MKTAIIKGTCENCGTGHEGEVTLVDGAFPRILCPKCGVETENFDEKYVVDAQEKEEDMTRVYVKTESYKTI